MTDALTAPTLPETLARLAQLLPERVRAEMGEADDVEPWVFRYEAKYCGWQTVWWGGDMPASANLGALEMTLREECRARGWRWWVFSRTDGQYGATVYRTGHEGDRVAPDPAHALAMALLSALGGEGA